MRRFRSIPTSPRPFRSAFTLIEVLIVISIMGVILAMGIPSLFRSWQKEGLRKAVSDVVEASSHARAMAIFQGAPADLVIRAEDGQISVQRAHTAGSALATPDQEESEDRKTSSVVSRASSFSAQLPDDVAVSLIYKNFQDQMDRPEVRVRFFPNGTCDEFTIILFSPTGEQKVSLDVVTALADVEIIR